MNRREFIKLGAATLATLWCVRISEESNVAEYVDFLEEIKTEELEYNCDSCPWYMCSSSCPHYAVAPYFVEEHSWK